MRYATLALLLFSSLLMAQQPVPLLAKKQFPVVVENLQLTPQYIIQKDGWASLSGTVRSTPKWTGSRIVVTVSIGDNQRIFRHEIALPPQSNKQFRISIYTNHENKATVLVTGAGQVFHEQKFSFDYAYADQILRVLYVSTKRGGGYLKDLEEEHKNMTMATWNSLHITISSATPEELPDHWYEYDHVDVIVLCGPVPVFSREHQRKMQALQQWLYSGGVLLVNPLTANFPSSSPLFLQLWQHKEPPTTGIKNIAFGVEVPNATEGGLQLITCVCPERNVLDSKTLPEDTLWAIDRGYGKLIYMGLPMEKYKSQSFTVWLKALLPFLKISGSKSRLSKMEDDYHVGKRHMTRRKMPSLLGITFCIFLYFIVVGPVNFVVLRRKNRTIYLLLTIPAISLLFSLFVLGYGYLSKGASTHLTNIAIVHPIPETDYCYERGYLSIFSGHRARHDIRVETGVIEKLGTEQVTYEMERGMKIAQYPFNLWQMEHFRTQRLMEHGAISVAIENEKVTIAKPANITLRKLLLLDSFRFYPLGDFATEDTQKSFARKTPIKTSSRTFREDLAKVWGLEEESALLFYALQWKHKGLNQQRMVLAFFDTKGEKNLTISPNPNHKKSLRIFAVTPKELSK